MSGSTRVPRLWYEQAYFQNLLPEDKVCLSVMLPTWQGRYSTKRDAWSIPVEHKTSLERFVERHRPSDTTLAPGDGTTTLTTTMVSKATQTEDVCDRHEEEHTPSSIQQDIHTIEWSLPTEWYELMEDFWKPFKKE